VNTATVSSDTPPPDGVSWAEAEASFRVYVPHAKLTLTKAVNQDYSQDYPLKVYQDNPLPGSEIYYTLTIRNDGPDDVHNVVVEDILLFGITYLDYETDAGTYDPDTGKWTISTLPIGQEETLTLWVEVDGDQAGETITNTAEVPPIPSWTRTLFCRLQQRSTSGGLAR